MTLPQRSPAQAPARSAALAQRAYPRTAPSGARLQPGVGPMGQRPMAQRPTGQPLAARPVTERPAAPRFLTVAEVAGIMRVSKMTVYRLVHGGELAAVRVGRSFRVPEPAVRDYLAEARTDVA